MSLRAHLVQERERVDRIPDARVARRGDVERVRDGPWMPLEVVVERQGVAAVPHVADDGTGPDVPEMAEAAEVGVANEALRSDQTDGATGEPIVAVRHGQSGERRADRAAKRRVDVVARVRMEPSRGSRLTEVIGVRDGTLHGARRERGSRGRIVRAGTRIGVEASRPDDVAPRRDRVTVDQPDPAHPSDQLLDHPGVGGRVTTGVPTSEEAHRREYQSIAIVAQRGSGYRLHLWHGHRELAVPDVFGSTGVEPGVERCALPTRDLR